MNYSTGFYHVETNEWASLCDTRAGKRKAKYEDYYNDRQEKRQMCRIMSKTDKSVVVWEADTPRCGTQSSHDINVKMHTMFDNGNGENHGDNVDDWHDQQY